MASTARRDNSRRPRRLSLEAFRVQAFGVIVAVRVDDAALITPLREGMRQVLLGEDSSPPDAILEISRRVGQPLADLVDDLDSQFRFLVAQFSREMVFIHAGVVARRGKAAMFPAPSHSGKSHLVAKLIAAGADYVSDEHAILDGEGMVHPWYKPLALRSGVTTRQRNASPAEFGARHIVQPLPVRLIFATHFEPDAVWRPQRLPPTQGAQVLLANAVAARIQPERVMQAAARAAQQATAFKSARPDSADVVPEILKMLDELP